MFIEKTHSLAVKHGIKIPQIGYCKENDVHNNNWPIPSNNANCSEIAPGKALPKLSYFSSYSLSLDYCNFAVFQNRSTYTLIYSFNPFKICRS
jgi:hypothetical protein